MPLQPGGGGKGIRIGNGIVTAVECDEIVGGPTAGGVDVGMGHR